MRFLNQIAAVTRLNILNLPQRIATSVVAIVGVTAVVLVFAAVLSMAKGFERTLIAAGSDDVAIVLRSGATSEMMSGFSHEQTQQIANMPGVRKEGDQSISSAELFVIVDVPKIKTGNDANVPFRGVDANAFGVRNDVTIVDGRMFETGKNEMIVGRGAQLEFAGLETGATIRFGRVDWQVVGAFTAGASARRIHLG